MKQKNEIEAVNPSQTTDFLPSDGASCSAFDDSIAIAKGCLDYGGGYRSSEGLLDVFHHGIQTVVNALEAARKASETGKNDTQVNALRRMGNSLPNAIGEARADNAAPLPPTTP